LVPKPIEVVFQPSGKRMKFLSGITILEAALNLGINISSICGGKGTCGKCKVIVQKGVEGLSPLTKRELQHLSEEEISANVRLACQTQLMIPSLIYIPLRSRIRAQRLQTEGLEIQVHPDPLLRKYFIHLPQPTLYDPRSDEDRLLDSLNKQWSLSNLTIDLEVSRDLPIIFRRANWNVTAVVWKNEIRAIELGDTSETGWLPNEP
jgi:uncharacterized 2Fe-2S/4Fe-4S cluster protein (DUF4445 family)